MRHVRWSSFFLLLWVGCAVPASAQEWGRGWLERLSGPGPFSGTDYGFTVGCFTEPASDSSGFSFFRSSGKSKAVACIDINFGNYANEESKRPQQGLVSLFRSEALLMWSPPLAAADGGVEVGAGLGNLTFRGDAFDFGRFYVPLRLAVKPFRFFIREGHRRETGIVRLVYTILIVPDALRQEDFNIPGLSFKPDHVLYPGAKIGLVADFSSYLFNR